MLFHPHILLSLSAATAALAQQPGTFIQKGDTLVSGMMVRFRDRSINYTLTFFFFDLTDVFGQSGQGLHSRQGRRK